MVRMARSARTTGEIPDVRPPWHKRYRLLVQLGGLVALGGVLAAIVMLLSGGGGVGFNEENAQLRRDLRPLMDSIILPPADLPEGWRESGGGLGLQGALRTADLGAATAVAEGPVGAADGWSDGVGVLSSGIIVAESPELARAAFERLREASPEETLRYAEATAIETLLYEDVAVEGGVRFGFTAAVRRGTITDEGELVEPDVDAGATELQFTVTVIWEVRDRVLLFVAYNGLFSSPPEPVTVDLEGWLGDLVRSYLAAAAGLLLADADTDADAP